MTHISSPDDYLPPVPGNKYVHGVAQGHCGSENPCPATGAKCACGEDVRAEEEAS